jgi:ribonuclease P protein component
VVHLATVEGHESQSEPARVGFIVSKAVGGAVVRNRVRRRLQHLVRECLATLPSSSSLVVRVLPPAAGLDSPELGAELTRCLDRVLQARGQGESRAVARTGAGS